MSTTAPLIDRVAARAADQAFWPARRRHPDAIALLAAAQATAASFGPPVIRRSWLAAARATSRSLGTRPPAAPELRVMAFTLQLADQELRRSPIWSGTRGAALDEVADARAACAAVLKWTAVRAAGRGIAADAPAIAWLLAASALFAEAGLGASRAATTATVTALVAASSPCKGARA
ncbi:hypothetical protein CU254_41985 (plasmid) [Amycolatopsis sp. AA4]|uniref:hypothetical protein n=1 Tax=Actinomycetes TaxID=1760 RepID=UPI0001B56C1A|nr:MULTISPECIES: hypothetical protein [Actinomycetes]ATY17150.1 hypothetical protein CU254_41985 [Amycolatopsis sp. AA4]